MKDIRVYYVDTYGEVKSVKVHKNCNTISEVNVRACRKILKREGIVTDTIRRKHGK